MKTHISRAAGLLAAVLACSIVPAAPLAAQAAAALSLDDAVATALSKDPGVISANLDYLSAQASAESAKWKRMPSISANVGASFFTPLYYVTPPSGQSFLGQVPDASIDLSISKPGLKYNLTPPDHYVSTGLNLSYPVYDGDRAKQSIAIAGLQANLKDVARETVKRTLAFNVTRAYWEAARASYNVDTLKQNLVLMKQNADLASRQLSQGVATRADELAAQIRLQQTTRT